MYICHHCMLVLIVLLYRNHQIPLTPVALGVGGGRKAPPPPSLPPLGFAGGCSGSSEAEEARERRPAAGQPRVAAHVALGRSEGSLLV